MGLKEKRRNLFKVVKILTLKGLLLEDKFKLGDRVKISYLKNESNYSYVST